MRFKKKNAKNKDYKRKTDHAANDIKNCETYRKKWERVVSTTKYLYKLDFYQEEEKKKEEEKKNKKKQLRWLQKLLMKVILTS